MTIRTLENLSDALSSEIIWRKKELSSYKFLVENRAISEGRKNTLIRGGFAIIYAHWEGFIKASTKYYLEFISFQRLTYRQLSPNFIALGLKGFLRKNIQSNRVINDLEIVNFFSNRLDERCILPYKEGISTQSNLTSEVLKNIIDSLGLDYSYFELKANFIDEFLLKNRNTIAHGEYLLVDDQSYIDLHNTIVDMLENFKTQLENSAILRKYLSSAINPTTGSSL